MQKSLGAMGIDTSKAVQRARSESRGRKRDRSAGRAEDDTDMAEQVEAVKRVHSSKSRSMSRGRSMSVADASPGSGLKDAAMRVSQEAWHGSLQIAIAAPVGFMREVDGFQQKQVGSRGVQARWAVAACNDPTCRACRAFLGTHTHVLSACIQTMNGCSTCLG